jgi:hypothetical protein
MHVHFSYHSQTQRTIHTTPFVWLVCAGGWLGVTTQEASELSGILVLLAFVWLFLTNVLMNALVRYRGARFGPLDLSKNAAPSPTEKLLNRVFLVVALAAGIITAAVSVQDVTHIESKNSARQRRFSSRRRPDRWNVDACGHRFFGFSSSAGAGLNLLSLRNARHLPLQSREARVVAVERDPLAAPLDRERSEPPLQSWRHSGAGVQPSFSAGSGTCPTRTTFGCHATNSEVTP